MERYEENWLTAKNAIEEAMDTQHTPATLILRDQVRDMLAKILDNLGEIHVEDTWNTNLSKG